MELREFYNRIKLIDTHTILKNILKNNDIQQSIISANQNQLSEHGIYSNEDKIKTYASTGSKVYADLTIKIKKEQGERTDIVTLYSTGNFFRTFAMVVSENYAQITANFNKQNGNISDNLDITNILGLTNENLNDIIAYEIYPKFIQEIKKQIGI